MTRMVFSRSSVARLRSGLMFCAPRHPRLVWIRVIRVSSWIRATRVPPSRSAPRPRPRATLARHMAELDLWSMLFVFMLATFVGFQVIQNVSRLLHTPPMSLTNAISAIAVVGAVLIAGEQESTATTILGAIAVAASMTNIVSGFLITDRMLKMFRERERKQ